jgi:hypothetical protein
VNQEPISLINILSLKVLKIAPGANQDVHANVMSLFGSVWYTALDDIAGNALLAGKLTDFSLFGPY